MFCGPRFFGEALSTARLFQSCRCFCTDHSARGILKVRGLQCHGYAGVLAPERLCGQTLACDLELVLSKSTTHATAHSDALKDTVDFEVVSDIAVALMRAKPGPYLLERMCRRILDAIHTQFRGCFDSALVRVRKLKPSVSFHCGSVGVQATIDGDNTLTNGSLFIDKLVAHSFVGDIPFETQLGRKVAVDLVGDYANDQFDKAAISDSLEDAIDSRAVGQLLSDSLSVPQSDGSHREMLEAFHSVLTHTLLREFPRIQSCHLEIQKPEAVIKHVFDHISYSVQ